MTPALFDELECLFVTYERGKFDGFASDAAIIAFQLSRGILQGELL